MNGYLQTLLLALVSALAIVASARADAVAGAGGHAVPIVAAACAAGGTD